MTLKDSKKTKLINFSLKNNEHKFSKERLLELSRLGDLSEPDFCDAVSLIDKNSSPEILEFLLKQRIILGNPYHAIEICGFLNRGG